MDVNKLTPQHKYNFAYGLHIDDRELVYSPYVFGGWYYVDNDRQLDYVALMPTNPTIEQFEYGRNEIINYAQGKFISYDDKKYVEWFVKEFKVEDFILNRLSEEHLAFLNKYNFTISTENGIVGKF